MYVLNVVLRRKELVEVDDGSLELFSQQRFSLFSFLLLDQVQANDRGTIATKTSQEVETSRSGKRCGSINYTNIRTTQQFYLCASDSRSVLGIVLQFCNWGVN